MAVRQRRLVDEVERLFPKIEALVAIELGDITVDGVPVRNTRSWVREGSVVRHTQPAVLRGTAKLEWALAHFQVPVQGRCCLDVGASAGGFTTALLEHGASRVYAVDVGFGQLRGSLAQDPRVVVLEQTNIADLNKHNVPGKIDLFTVDVSYLSLTDAIPQLAQVGMTSATQLLGLVKPMFELGRSYAPRDDEEVASAIELALAGAVASGWVVEGSAPSPIEGSHAAKEGWILANRA